jgi:hypothetical protein
MGNCIDKGDSADKATPWGTLLKNGGTFTAKGDAGNVKLVIGTDNTFTLEEFEGDATDAKTSWTGVVREEDGKHTFDASAENATTSDVKTFTAELAESGNMTLGHKFIGDLEELAPQGEVAAKEGEGEGEGEKAAAE